MKKRVLCLFLALALLSGCGASAFADGGLITGGLITNLVNSIKDITFGGVIRDLKSATKYEDMYHVLSANGESVTLTNDTVLNNVLNLIYSIKGNYTIKYKWYTCDAFMQNSRQIKGATGETLMTEPFSAPGLKYYYCKADVYKKIGLLNFSYKSFTSPLYVVGFTGLPVIYIDTPGEQVITSNEEWLYDSSVRIVGGPCEDYELETLPIRIKGRGNSSWDTSSKCGYTFKFDKKQDLFGIGKDKTWALIGNFSDKSLIRNWFASELDKQIFDDNSEWNVTHKNVELVMNGEYRGNYTLATTVRLGDNRIDVPDISDKIKKDLNGDGAVDFYDAGFVVEIDDRRGEAYVFDTKIAGVPFTLSDPDLDEPADSNEAIFQHIKGVVQNAENVLYSEGFTDPESGYAKYIDIDSFADWYLLEELSKNPDGHFNLSTYMYYQPKDGKLHMASGWDFDIAFGNNASDSSNPQGFGCNRGWFTRLLQDPVFVEEVISRWNAVRTVLPQFVNSELYGHAEMIRTSAILNFCKWPELGTLTWPQTPGWWMRWTYMSEVDYLANWLQCRINWLNEEGIPSLNDALFLDGAGIVLDTIMEPIVEETGEDIVLDAVESEEEVGEIMDEAIS